MSGPRPRRSPPNAEVKSTSRGFAAPSGLLEELAHERERFLIVRVSSWEMKQLRDGIKGKVTVLGREDGTFDLVLVVPGDARRGHHGHLRSYPPYVGGDDDEIEAWQAECCGCGWLGRKTEYVSVAYGELVEHLNAALGIA